MITKICGQSFELSHVFKNIYLVFVIALFLLDPTILLSQESPVSLEDKLYKQTKIAFTSERDGNIDIYVMNADGSEQKRLTNSPAQDANPSFSPDGNKIAFTSNRDGNVEIYVMNADGTEQKKLTNNSVVDYTPSWSPDGNKIAFRRGMDENSDIYAMNSDGSEQIRLTNNPDYDGHPAWSPYLKTEE